MGHRVTQLQLRRLARRLQRIEQRLEEIVDPDPMAMVDYLAVQPFSKTALELPVTQFQQQLESQRRHAPQEDR